MHLSLKTSTSIDDGDNPANPTQLPADIIVLSFTDSDLACMGRAYRLVKNTPSLCLTNLTPLKHPLSVDLYIEQVAAHAKVILVRLLGGQEWWRYGSEELGRVAREKNIALIMVPGCGHADERLASLSTVEPAMVAAIDQCLAHGGMQNTAFVLQSLSDLGRGSVPLMPVPIPVASGMLYRDIAAHSPLGQCTIIFYRAHYLASDVAPIDALLQALAAQDVSARAFMVKSLKDAESIAALRADVCTFPPDVIIDATAFTAGEKAHPLADCNVPILQCALANSSKDVWETSPRGLTTTDLAMHVVLPEADGRIFTRAISFKAEAANDASIQFSHVVHTALADRVEYVAQAAAHWVRLAKKEKSERSIALILSDYPDRAGRNAYAVGLDGPRSALEILRLLAEDGYKLDTTADLDFSHCATEVMRLETYNTKFHALPLAHQRMLTEAWGMPQDDACFSAGAFHLPCIRSGNVIVALQPDRGSLEDKKSGYHDAKCPPRHGYLAFYWWLRDTARIDALIHLGTHGNLEWLPGKAAALSAECWPEIALGPLPVLYPYIVSDPGEAAQAKRRISAVIISHLTPPLMPVHLSPELSELETLIDEFSAADGLDARRMKYLREEILHRARRAGLPGEDDNALMTALESHLCDIKEQRVGDGLHIFGKAPEAAACASMAEALERDKEAMIDLLTQSAASEASNLLAALDGKFIMPGTGGSPVRGRLDILPTGRNLVTIDPRMIPTPTAAIIGKRSAEEFIRRYTQDHGDWPKSIVMDVWGASTLRNGGDEIAQALWLMGIDVMWDKASGRVSGFTRIADSDMAWKRVDVTLRVSGLFRDMFANLMTLFDDATRVAHGVENELRIFGNAPGAYGAGVTHLLDSGQWTHRDELGQAYMEASHFAYGRDVDGVAKPELFKERVATADALIHVQDIREMDVLSGADFADAEGGFAAAAQKLGNDPSLYHMDTSRPQAIKARTLNEEISLTLQARALNADWIAGQMRHAYAGAASLADVVDQLFSFAATSDTVPSQQFDQLFDAYLHDETVRHFIECENPQALQAMKARFEEAVRRGLWNPLRNSVWTLLDITKDAAA